MSDMSSCLKMPFLQKIKRKKATYSSFTSMALLQFVLLRVFFFSFEEMSLKINGRGRCNEDSLTE